MNTLTVFLFLVIFVKLNGALTQNIHKFIENNAYLCTLDDKDSRFLLEKEAKEARCEEICGEEIKACAMKLKSGEIFCQNVSKACLREFNLEFNTDIVVINIPDGNSNSNLDLPSSSPQIQTTSFPFNEEEAISALNSLNQRFFDKTLHSEMYNNVFTFPNYDNDLADHRTSTIMYPSLLENVSSNQISYGNEKLYTTSPLIFNENLVGTPIAERIAYPPSATPYPEENYGTVSISSISDETTPASKKADHSLPSVLEPEQPNFFTPPPFFSESTPQIQTSPSTYTQDMVTEKYEINKNEKKETIYLQGYDIPRIKISTEKHGTLKNDPNYENGYKTSPTNSMKSTSLEQEFYPKNFNIGFWIHPFFEKILNRDYQYLPRTEIPEGYRTKETHGKSMEVEEKENPNRNMQVSGETDLGEGYDNKRQSSNEVSLIRPRDFGLYSNGNNRNPYNRYFPIRLYNSYGPHASYERPYWSIGNSNRDYRRRKESKKESLSTQGNPEKCYDLYPICSLIVRECNEEKRKMCPKKCSVCK